MIEDENPILPAAEREQPRERQRIRADGNEPSPDRAHQQHERGAELIDMYDTIVDRRQQRRDRQKNNGNLAAAIQRREQEIEPESHSQKDARRQTGKFEEAVSDLARRDEQQRQHHANAEL